MPLVRVCYTVRELQGIHMEILELDIETVYQDPNNVRLHDEKNLDAIKGSLKKFGWQHPIIIDDNNIILAGNGRHVAAKELGYKTIPCVRSDLENYDKMAFSLADNRSAELASWDMPKLEEQLKLIDEPDLLGFDDDFLPLDDNDTKPSTDTIEGAKELDEDDFDNFDKQCPKCGFEWDDKK